MLGRNRMHSALITDEGNTGDVNGWEDAAYDVIVSPRLFMTPMRETTVVMGSIVLPANVLKHNLGMRTTAKLAKCLQGDYGSVTLEERALASSGEQVYQKNWH